MKTIKIRNKIFEIKSRPSGINSKMELTEEKDTGL